MDVHKTHLSNVDFKKMLLSELQDITDISLKTVKDRAPVELDQQATGRLREWMQCSNSPWIQLRKLSD